VIFFVNAAEVFLVHVGVNLGGSNIRMAKHFLHAAQVGTALEQMGAETVAEGMGADFPD